MDFFLRFSSKLLTALGLKWSSKGIDSKVRTPILSFFYKTDLRPTITGGGRSHAELRSHHEKPSFTILCSLFTILAEVNWPGSTLTLNSCFGSLYCQPSHSVQDIKHRGLAKTVMQETDSQTFSVANHFIVREQT